MSLEINFGCQQNCWGRIKVLVLGHRSAIQNPHRWKEQSPAVSWARPKLSCLSFLTGWNYWTFLFYCEIHCCLFAFLSRTKPRAFYLRNRSLPLCARETIVVAWCFNLVCYGFGLLFTNEPYLRSECLLLGCLFVFVVLGVVKQSRLSLNSFCRSGWTQTHRDLCLCLSSTGIRDRHCPHRPAQSVCFY